MVWLVSTRKLVAASSYNFLKSVNNHKKSEMGSNDKVPTMLCIIAVIIFSASAAPTANDAPFHSSLDNFSHNLFSEIFQSKGEQNIIFSPFSIQSSLAMVRMAADGETATEMDQGLSFTGQSTESVADNYYTMLAKYEKSHIVNIANKVYVMKGYELEDKYKEVLSKKFLSPAENIDFSQTKQAVAAINAWVESKTNNVIKDLVKPDLLTSDTRLFLLSAIYFKGNWETPFEVTNTREQDFYIDESNTVKVQMMFKETKGFADFPELEASAVRLPYKNSDLSMMIILPKTRNGLEDLVDKLKNVQLKTLTSEFTGAKVDLRVPKFKAEFEIELTDTLKKMGMEKMFADADFNKMLKSSGPVNVGHVIHKAFIEVNEQGTEAAAATGTGIQLMSAPMRFTANHPFYYVIMNGDSVPLFQGTFVGV